MKDSSVYLSPILSSVSEPMFAKHNDKFVGVNKDCGYHLGDGELLTVATAAVKVNQAMDLIGLTTHERMIETGFVNYVDIITKIKIQTVYYLEEGVVKEIDATSFDVDAGITIHPSATQHIITTEKGALIIEMDVQTGRFVARVDPKTGIFALSVSLQRVNPNRRRT